MINKISVRELNKLKRKHGFKYVKNTETERIIIVNDIVYMKINPIQYKII